MDNNGQRVKTGETLWDVDDVAGYLNVSTSWVYNAVASGNLPVVRVGSLLRFNPDAMRDLVGGGKAASVTLPGCREVAP